MSKIPIISSPLDLVGKLVLHFIERDGFHDWFQGVILSRVSQAVKNPKFLIQYVTQDESKNDTAVENLFADFKNGKLKLYTVEPKNFVNAKIETMYLEDDTGAEIWWKGEVADIDTKSDDPSNPDFFVYYDTEDETLDPEYFLEQLLELYLNGSVRLLDYPI